MQALARPLKWPPVFPLEKGLVLWLPFDERSGAKAYDHTGKANHGTLYGPTWVAGRRGSALSFDGLDDYVKVAYNAVFNITDEITLVSWVKLTELDRRHIVMDKFYGAGVVPYRLFVSSENTPVLDFYDGDWRMVISSEALTLGAWYFLAGTHDKNLATSNMKIYVNGVLKATTNYAQPLPTNSIDVYIGNYDIEWCKGVIAEVRIYNRALTAAEVKRLYEDEIILTRW